MKVHVANHPLISHKLTVLRDEKTDSPTFRRLVEELVTLLAYEATRDVKTTTVTIKTPVYKTKKEVVTVGGKKVTKTVPALDKNGKPTVLRTITKTVNIALPNLPITVYYRTDSSGTSEQFGKFLQGANAGANSIWWPKTASGTFGNMTPEPLSNFFNFQGANGSALVAAGVKGKVGAIGYAAVICAMSIVSNVLSGAIVVERTLCPQCFGTPDSRRLSA